MSADSNCQPEPGGRRGWLRWGAGLALGVGLGWLALRGLDPSRVAAQVASAELAPLAGAFALGWCSYRLRAVRWGWLLWRGSRAAPQRELFGILMLGYFLNNLLPARAGEIARIALMRRLNAVPAARTLATIVAERVMDGFVLGAAGWWALERALQLDVPWLRSLAVGFAVLLVLLAFVAGWQPRLSRWLLERSSRAPERVLRWSKHLGELLEQVGGLAQPAAAARVLGLTLLIWVLEGCVYACVGTSFATELDLAQLAAFVAVVNFASLIPTPGGLGAVELAGASVLAQSGVAKETAFVLVGVQHALQYSLCAVFGLWHMGRLGLLGRRRASVIRARDFGSA